METLLLDILEELRKTGVLDEKRLARIIHAHNLGLKDNQQHYAKKKLLPYYLKVKESDPSRWAAWGVDEATEKLLFATLQVKPRRTASGVATITVLTKPWMCAGACLYCPSDLRMPKSYLAREPACQRAERNFFDPYLQVASRLRALAQMGHDTDKIELIILGGTWSDYPESYQVWFVAELFRALNDTGGIERNAEERRSFYKAKGLSNRADELSVQAAPLQLQVNRGEITYNQAAYRLYGESAAWLEVAQSQVAGFDELERQHAINETAAHRAVGLVVESRPDAVTCESLTQLRRLGCTKVQMGIQSLDPLVLRANSRAIGLDTIRNAFELARVFGFKVHAHFMVNLYGSTPEADIRDYRRFVTESAYLPDEVKLYPCVLVEGTGLCRHFDDKTWKPYRAEELVEVLTADVLNTPPFVRLSRMVRDISADDILAGNTKANLRQLVEERALAFGAPINEIRHREINLAETDIERLALEVFPYETTATDEFFLQWVTPVGRIAGFLRLSLPKADYVRKLEHLLPVKPDEAMIREVHVYGKVARLHESGTGAQHLGLGRRIIEAACEICVAKGYRKVNVISAIGTREYYRALGFADNGLYQQKPLGFSVLPL
ncbi:MAG: tRNA uridine(34) 5-carboxymethylaminomethyl modification radical SAM/GNAT enzyme Elp3 [Eggerthellaceae bacterium]|nr:tRNA uridine(34) 5-carboxymethylaminomethyl modification radical SAM/GNAT enzyme Elp3 [Eggerthellaceae bacterium]